MKILAKLLVALVSCSFVARTIIQGVTDQPSTKPAWSELIASMDKMHMAIKQ